MTLYWDRANHPIADVLEWARLFEDPGYRYVALDIEGHRSVSTIWQGLNIGFAMLAVTDETAFIFETAYFVEHEMRDSYPAHSEEGALALHTMLCEELLGRPPRPEDGHLQAAIERDRRA